MALAYWAVGTTVYTTASGTTLTVPSTNAVNDILVLAVVSKPDTTSVATPSGWTLLGTAAGGSGAVGGDTGPVRVTVFTRTATANNQGSGTITFTGNNISGGIIVAYRPMAGTTVDIVGTGAADTTANASFTATMPVNPGLTVNDQLLAIGAIPTDIQTPTAFAPSTISATGMTTVTTSELNEFDSNVGNQIGGLIHRGVVVTGTATAAPTVTSAVTGTTTNVMGPIYLVRLREVLPAPVPVHHSSSPPVVKANQAAAMVTASFTPPDNSVIVVNYTSDDASGTQSTASTISNTGGLTFTEVGNYRGGGGGRAALWTAKVTTSPGAMTITCDNAGDTNVMPQLLAVRVYDSTQVDIDDPIGALSQALITASTTNLSVSLTPETTGGGLRQIYIDWNATGVPATLQSNTWLVDSQHLAGSSTNVQLYKSVGTVTGVAQTIGATLPAASTSIRHITYELRAPSTGDTPKSGSDSGTFSATETAVIEFPTPRADSGTFSATETASVAVILSTSDTGTLSATETSALGVVLSASDSGTIAAVESSSNLSTLARTDAGTFSVTETINEAFPDSRTDTGTFSVTEAVTISVVLASSDSGTISATDTSNVVVTTNALSLNDSGTFSATESSVNALSSTRADTGTLSVTDTSSNLITIAVTDGGTISATDTVVTIANTLSTSDSGTLSATESVAIQNSFTRTDSGTLSVTDTATGAGTGALTETATISATDTAAVLVAFTVTDSGIFSATDTSDLQVFGVISKSGSDSGTFSVTESVSMQQMAGIAGSDSGTISATEGRAIASSTSTSDTGTLMGVEAINVASSSTRTDSGTLSATETAFVFNDRPGVDSGVFSVTETASVVVTGLVLKNASDSGTFSATDSVSQRAVFVSVSDTGTITGTDASTSALYVVVTDSGTFSVTESTLLFRPVSGADSGTFSIVENADVVSIVGTQVAAWNGNTMLFGTLYLWNGTTMVNPPIWVWDGSAMVAVS